MLPAQACLIAFALLEAAEGHAWLQQPPGRSSAWRFGFGTPVNYNDNELNCGGYLAQHTEFDGKCGMCGDPYGGPRANEPGQDNVYAKGVIVANYTQGQSIPVKIKITASHKGYHEFRLCINDMPHAGHEMMTVGRCDAKDPSFPILRSPDGRTKFDEMDPAIVLQLPADVTCKACILQWRWRTGNRWGCDAEGCGVGHGPQEEFYGCADVRIVAALRPTFTSSAAGNTIAPSSEQQTSMPAQQSFHPSTTSGAAADTLETAQATGTVATQTGVAKLACKAAPPYGADVGRWCNAVCNSARPYCPASHCQCANAQG